MQVGKQSEFFADFQQTCFRACLGGGIIPLRTADRAEQAIAREKEQASKKRLDTAVSIGTAILGALLGRKKLSSSSATRIGSAIKTAGGARKEAADVERARATADKARTDLAALEQALQTEVDALDTPFDAQSEALDEIIVRAKTTDIHVPLVALAWLPYTPGPKGRLRPAWKQQSPA